MTSTTAACSSSARRRPGSSSPTRSAAADDRSRSPSANTCGCRGRYRGRDVFWWMDAAGILDERHDEVDDLVRARHLPSPQLIGSPERRSIDLNALDDRGRPHRRSARRHHRRHRPVLGRARQHLHARRPQDEPPARHLRRLGRSLERLRHRPGERFEATRVPATPRASRSISATTTSAPSSGRPATDPTTAGSTFPCSTARVASATTAASCRRSRHVPARRQPPAPPAIELHQRRRSRHRRTRRTPRAAPPVHTIAASMHGHRLTPHPGRIGTRPMAVATRDGERPSGILRGRCRRAPGSRHDRSGTQSC